ALDRRPGVYSARFAGPGATDAETVEKLLAELKGVVAHERSARFRCAMVYVARADDPAPLICEGTWEGKILAAPRGKNGFGYDPVFWVDSEQASAAELEAERKNALSHRGQAIRALVFLLIGPPPGNPTN
ncbi:MAG: non-canonical purine NTP pyrophosphatase, partial [Gammaproteobacteria bacterium]